MIRITRFLILGVFGGFLGWLIVEPINYLTPPGNPKDTTYIQWLLTGALVGMFIGVGLGMAEALSGMSRRDAMKSVITGALVGAAGGALGLAFGNALYQPVWRITGDPLDPATAATRLGPLSPILFLLWLIGRSLGWGLFGLFIGTSQGLSTESSKKLINGAVGGFVGGGVGGLAFVLLLLMNRTGAIAITPEFARLLGFSVMGASIGLFIGFIEEMTKQAWLVRLQGRNEGKEFLMFKPETVIGRDEFADVPIFGDPDVEPRHFVIRANERRHVLFDMNTVAGTSVNGQKVQQQQLKDGDIIQVGMTKLLFRDKATRSFVQRTTADYTAGPQIPTSAHICQFCGSIKDAAGNCACTVGGAPAPSADQTVVSSPTQNVTVVQPSQPTQQQTVPFGEPVQAPTGGGAKFVAVAGPYSGQAFTLAETGETTIGRQSDRSISLANDNTVSRQHARVVNEGGQFVVYDLGSANGTHVNNAKITQQPLNNGDFVQIGSTKFRFEM